MSLDSINTFNGYINFSSKTTVIRQHEDRFRDIQPIKAGTEMKLYRQIDNIDEGITPTKLKASDTRITDSAAKLNQTWYLVYRSLETPTANSPIEC